MSLSSDARHRNLDEALVSFIEALGEEWFSAFYIMRSAFPHLLPTTWTDLTKSGLLKDMDMNVEAYQFTPFGYVRALKISRRSDDPEFRARLGSIARVLKDSVKGRSDFEFVSVEQLLTDSGVSREFAYNALDADLIRHVLGRIGAEWAGDHLVRVPNDFGLVPM